MSEDRITEAIRGYKRNSRERKELTDPDLRDSAIEKPDNPDSKNYGPRNPSIKSDAQRYTKEQVDYTDHSKTRDDCDDCIHFNQEDGKSCELVKGLIKMEGWCRKFTALSGGHHEEEEEEES